MITKQNLINHEFVGMDVFVEFGSINSRMTHRGKILLETKNSFVIRQRENIKIFPKSSIKSLRVEVEDGVCFIKGSTLLGNAEDRVFK
jgi:RNase P/RNase MRP subunit p29